MTAAAFDISAALIVVLDRAGCVLRFNAACEQLSGYREADIVGQLLWPLVMDASDAARLQEAYTQLTPDNELRAYEYTWITPQGRRSIAWKMTFLLDEAGDIEVVVATGLDVTEERATRLERAESDARFRALFDHSADGVVLVDPHDPAVPWRIVDCNAAFARMNGYPQDSLIGQSIDLLHERAVMVIEGPERLEWIRAQAPQARGEGTHRHADGSVFPIETTSSVIMLGGQELVLGLDRDISERKRTEAQLRALNAQLVYDAHHDALTGLPNRALLLDRLAMELTRSTRSGKALAVMFLDLDDFKRVNDTLGHAAGDVLLREVVARLQRTLRPSDTVARVGGDEFVVLIPDVSSVHHAARVAQRLQDALVSPVSVEGLKVTLGVSIGISMSPQDGADVDELLRHADLAMYEIKKSGKNAVRFYEPVMNAAAQARLRLETRLRKAIATRTLTLVYQPQVNVKSGTLVGLEALARWTDARLGVVSPGEFIPVAEDTGLIVPLGAWVLDEACRQAAAWHLPVPIAVNISPAQVLRPEFIDMVQDTLQRHGLAPTQLKLELTERLSVRDPALAIRTLTCLRNLGVTLSLDDFGSGQSAVASLLTLPLQEVKLDRSLLSGVTDDPQSWQVLGALLSLARGLNLPVVVEGVETPAQLQVLATLGAATVQGYLTGRPATPEVIAQQYGRIQPPEDERQVG